MKKTLALFDFDHTLYNKDSLLEITKYIVGNRRFYSGMLLLSPYLIAMKLGILDNARIKQKYLKHFFGNMDYEQFKMAASTFSLNSIENDLDIALKTSLNKHIDNNADVYVVTASFAEWIEPWCSKNNVLLISSKLEIINGKITGNISGLNCNGKEKVVRIKNTVDLTIYDTIYVYGKGKGDREMLSLKKS